MSLHERLSQWWRSSARFFETLAVAGDYDPHEESGRRLAALERRLEYLEGAGREPIGSLAASNLFDKGRG